MNSKQKGNSFEREISKKLSLWISNGVRKDLMYRTHSSGARFTQNKKMGNNVYGQAGDITSTHPDSVLFSENYVVETKSYKQYDFFNFFKDDDTSNVIKIWWKKLSLECLDENKNPILIFKFNNKPIMICINENDFNKLVDIECYSFLKFSSYKLYICKFDDFLKTDYKLFINKIMENNNAI